MIGYKEDTFGNFYPVEVDDTSSAQSSKRAQGPLTTNQPTTVYNGVTWAVIGTLSAGSSVTPNPGVAPVTGANGTYIKADLVDSATGTRTPASWIAQSAISGYNQGQSQGPLTTNQSALVFNGVTWKTIGMLSSGSTVKLKGQFSPNGQGDAIASQPYVLGDVTDSVTGTQTPAVWIPQSVVTGAKSCATNQRGQALVNIPVMSSYLTGQGTQVGTIPKGQGCYLGTTKVYGSKTWVGISSLDCTVSGWTWLQNVRRAGQPITPAAWRQNPPPRSPYLPQSQSYPSLSGIAVATVPGTPSGMVSPYGYPVIAAPAYPTPRPRRHHYRPLPASVMIPQRGVNGVDAATVQVLLQEAQEQGAEQATLQALIQQMQSGASLSSAFSTFGLDYNNILSNAGMTVDAAGLPVPGGYLGTDSSGADLYADGGVDATGGALGDYTDPRSQY